jgi:hypothetical protein
VVVVTFVVVVDVVADVPVADVSVADIVPVVLVADESVADMVEAESVMLSDVSVTAVSVLTFSSFLHATANMPARKRASNVETSDFFIRCSSPKSFRAGRGRRADRQPRAAVI